MGILCEGHKHKLLVLLTFLEEECRIEAMAALSKRGTKARREFKNLKCSVNYDDRGECSSCGKAS